jgi:putative ABC transport system substrate-binding protein
MYALGDPVATGLVASLARPGGNVTGVTLMATGLAAKRLELLKEAVPSISKVLVLTYLVDPIAPPQLRELEIAANALGVKLSIRHIRSANDLPAAFDSASKEGAQGCLQLPSNKRNAPPKEELTSEGQRVSQRGDSHRQT